MLGYHTKQVTAYGKRRQRIVNDEQRQPKQPPSIFDDLPPPTWAPVASRMKKRGGENNTHAQEKPKSKSQSPKILHMSRAKKRLSPVLSPVARKMQQRKTLPQIRRLESEEGEALTPSRRPLGVRALNTPGSPAVVSKPKRSSGTPLLNQQRFSPFVDILVVDDQGQTISHERRVSGRRIIDSDSEDEPELALQPKPPRRLRQLAPLRIESDESDDEFVLDSDEDIPAAPSISVPVATIMQAPLRGRQPRLQVEVVLPMRTRAPPAPPAETPSPPRSISPTIDIPSPAPLRYQHFASPLPRARQLTPPIPRARQLTPIGGRRRGQWLNPPPSPPSPTTPTDLDELDLTIDISSLSITLSPPSRSTLTEVPEYLQPLLAECGQASSGLHNFSTFISTFPFDPLVSARGKATADAGGFRKIGEASYSEVFGIGDVVLKVIPLRDESQRKPRPHANVYDAEVDGPFATDAKDVLKEIIVTHAMGEVCAGFVKLLRTYVVRGTYPQVLLELWDEYYERKGSEGVRPDTFGVSQAYAIIVLPNGGPDLEAYTFPQKGGWKQACSVFWQVAKALAHAEQLVSFEHRDLHLGQILVKEVPPQSSPLQAVNQNRGKPAKGPRPMMDDPVHGVRATLIDLGLSRMDAGDGSGGEMVHWTPFEEEIFQGEGDYQFDIYRFMRAHNRGNWEAFNPLTNAMWLHYLAIKLLKAKSLKAPARPRKSTVAPPPGAGAASGSGSGGPSSSQAGKGFSDRECYECMLDLEEWLGRCVAAVVPTATKGKGRKKKGVPEAPPQIQGQTPAALLQGPLCAGEVVGYGVKKGWVRPVA
ncbi:Other/Haspin protein kinase [Mycena venus]|uniref:non-specific serine/threonine protein kinase n=1 Tax=Mycena venus TaxID=2733690 RepID=A0A8H6Y4J7_9AGAR|nr:Other/Haspin protein kinase [Mycena venus]